MLYVAHSVACIFINVESCKPCRPWLLNKPSHAWCILAVDSKCMATTCIVYTKCSNITTVMFYSTQIGAVTAFAQTLRRYTSLNHLAQAARAVLQNTSQINQMLSDLNRVDFANVQVSVVSACSYVWVGGCPLLTTQSCASEQITSQQILKDT